MKLVVLGASGGCGRHLVRIAAERGHEVTAVARGSSSVDAARGVRVLRGDVASSAFLREAVRGADAVLSALGLRLPGIAPWHKPEVPDLLSRSTPAIVDAMKAEGVRRVIAISAGGVGDSHDATPASFRAFVKVSAIRYAYAELEKMEPIYFQSGLDVCMCRPTGLTDEPATGKARVVERVTGRATIPRADVALWMLDEIVKPAFTARGPVVTVTGAD